MDSTSARFQFNTVDLVKTARHGVVVVVSYIGLTLLTALYSDITSGHISLGQLSMYQGTILTGVTMATEAVRRWATDHSA